MVVVQDEVLKGNNLKTNTWNLIIKRFLRNDVQRTVDVKEIGPLIHPDQRACIPESAIGMALSRSAAPRLIAGAL